MLVLPEELEPLLEEPELPVVLRFVIINLWSFELFKVSMQTLVIVAVAKSPDTARTQFEVPAARK